LLEATGLRSLIEVNRALILPPQGGERPSSFGKVLHSRAIVFQIEQPGLQLASS
jgi:hypothetical protein